MFHIIVGDIGMPGAIVLAGLFFGIGISFAIYRMTPRKTKEEHELDVMRLTNERDNTRYRWDLDNNYQMKKLEQNLITSHKEVSNHGAE